MQYCSIISKNLSAKNTCCVEYTIMQPLTSSQMFKRFVLACLLTTVSCLILAAIFLRITGVPPTYPPLLPQQIISGTIGGAFLVWLGYALLSAFINNQTVLARTVIMLGIVLTVASFYLPYRLTYTTSPRFEGVTVAAQVAQGFLHAVVVGLSLFCFLRRDVR